MKRLWSLVVLSALATVCLAQAGGGAATYQQGGNDVGEHAKRVITKEDLPPNASSTFVEASVLMNVKADEYVAVFGINIEGASPAECARKMDAVLARLSGE